MNKTILIIVVVGLIVFGGTAAYFMLGSGPDPVAALPPVPGGTPPTQGPVKRVSNASLGDLIALGLQASQLCTSVSGSTSSRAARVAVDDGKLRADIAVPRKFTGGTSHLILNDTAAYAWSDNAKYGFKMSRTGDGSSTDAALGANEPADYDCTPATLGGEAFRPPADVVFADLRDAYGDVCLTWVPVCPLFQMPTCSNGGWVCGDVGGVTAGFSFDGTPGGGGGTTGGGSTPQDEQATKEAYCAAACANAPEPQCRASLGCD